MFFKIKLYSISQVMPSKKDSVYFLKLTFRNTEKTTPYFLSRSEGCVLEEGSTFTWIDEKPIDEGDILTFELFNFRNSSIKKISLYQTLMECYSPYRIYYLSEQLENGIMFNFSLYYENYDNDLFINKSFNKQLTTSNQLNCKPFNINIFDFPHCFKQSDSSKSMKMISYGTFNKV